MDRAKFMITFLAVAGIMLGGYFLMQSGKDTDILGDGKTSVNTISLEKALKDAEENGGEFGSASAVVYTPTDPGTNITRLVAQSMFSKMKQLDSQGDNPFNGLDLADERTATIIDDTVKNVPETIFKTSIETSEIKVTQDNSRAAKMKYIEGIDRITKTRFVGGAGDVFKIKSSEELIDNFNVDCFESGTSAKNIEMSKAYLMVFNDYKNLTVPSLWIAMHKMILVHFKELSDIYGAFNQCKEDPIRAYVGMDKLPEVYARTADIQKIINAKAVELGIQ